MQMRVHLEAQVSQDVGSDRLDQIAASLFPDYSRSRLQMWIKSGDLLVDGKQRKAKDHLYGGEWIKIDATIEELGEHQPQAVEFDVIHEDDEILIVNKPVGLVVHPAPGHADQTLLNGLLYRYPDLSVIPRAGIVHRLDRDTSGLMAVARNLVSQNNLVAQLQARSVSRTYAAIVHGQVLAGGTVSAPINRHPQNRKKMAVRENGREAITRYKVITTFRNHSYLSVSLETGRTHQIRVHMSHIHHPLVGDPVYGGSSRNLPRALAKLQTVLGNFGRQALHAKRLALVHPGTGRLMAWEASLPADMQELLQVLSEFADGN